MKLLFGLFFVAAILFIACEQNRHSTNNVYQNTLKQKKAELYKSGQFVIKEDSSSFIGRVFNFKFRQGKIVLADVIQPSLFFIDTKGNIIKILRWKKGEGPGEIKRIGEFEILNDRIYISDNVNLRWSVFDTSGNFIKTTRIFKDTKSKNNASYYDGGKMVGWGNKLFNCIVEVKYDREFNQHKSKSIAIIDTTLVIEKVFGFMDEIYSRFRIYILAPAMTIDKNGFIYYTQRPTYKIYKYDSNGNYLKVFGVKGRFRVIDEDLPRNLSYDEINKKSKKFSSTEGLFSSPKGYILHQFVELNDKFFETRSFIDRINYLKVYDLEGNYINSEIKLPGVLMTIDEEGKLYIYEKDEPGNRIIGVYEIKFIDD